MPTVPDFNHPGYWHRRAEEARALAQHMSNEKAKETMLMVAADCDRFAVRAAERSIDELSHCRLLALAKPMRFFSGGRYPPAARNKGARTAISASLKGASQFFFVSPDLLASRHELE